MSYQATARLEDDWWIVEVEGVGVTQARSVREIPLMASGLVYAMTDVKDAEVAVRYVGGVFDDVERVRELQERAERQTAEASAAMRELVNRLQSIGLSGADVARVLGVTRQRVSQLSRPTVHRATARTK